MLGNRAVQMGVLRFSQNAYGEDAGQNDRACKRFFEILAYSDIVGICELPDDLHQAASGHRRGRTGEACFCYRNKSRLFEVRELNLHGESIHILS